jgi:hypothetical protein
MQNLTLLESLLTAVVSVLVAVLLVMAFVSLQFSSYQTVAR